jgi:hypothetical protein
MNEIILNHIKAYCYGVKDLQCPLLRAELGYKIDKFKQRMKKPRNQLKINYLSQNLSDDDDDDDMENSSKLKRKRANNDDDDDDKENGYYPRKVIIKSTITTVKNEQRTVIIKQITYDSNSKQEEKFDHEYCDIMYDNEFEGLHLAHFNSYDIEPSEEIERTSETDIEPSKDDLLVPITVLNEAEEKLGESQFIAFTFNYLFS